MSESNGPVAKRALAVYAIVDRHRKTYWLKVGAAFANRDGSITVYLDAMPVGTNRLQVREQRPWEEARSTNGQPAPIVEEVQS